MCESYLVTKVYIDCSRITAWLNPMNDYMACSLKYNLKAHTHTTFFVSNI